MDTNSITLHASDWDYLSEGNMHIILKYLGHDVQFIGKILRLVKMDKIQSELDIKSDEEAHILDKKLYPMSDIRSKVTHNIFEQHPIFAKFTKKDEVVSCNKQTFIKEITKQIENKRPEKRKNKTIDPGCSIYSMFDYSFTLNHYPKIKVSNYANITVEIKPKSPMFDHIDYDNFEPIIQKLDSKVQQLDIQNFFKNYCSQKAFDHKQTNEEKYYFTKFFKKQLKKLNSVNTKSLSQYRPIDFFSGSHKDVLNSISELLQSAQNNFKVFSDANQISIDNSQGKEQFMSLLNKFFPKQNDNGRQFSEFQEFLTQNIAKSKIREAILQFQHLYPGDGFNLEKVIEPLLSEKDQLLKETSINRIISTIKKDLNLVNEQEKGQNSDKMVYENESIMEQTLRFLLFSSLSDCSIMMSLHKIDHSDNQEVIDKIMVDNLGFEKSSNSDSQSSYYVKCGVIDFDLKGYEYMVKYFDQRRELIELFWKYIQKNQTEGGGQGSQ